MIKETKVVFSFPEVVFRDEKEWKKVPGYINAYAAITGDIRCLVNNEFFIPRSTYYRANNKQTNSSYKYAYVIDENLINSFPPVHRLICLTFNGNPPDDGKKYEPNHKNGIKNDNRAENLEWMTRSQNVQHAFDLGICAIGLRIEARNIYTKEVKNYNSISKMAREWGIKRNRLRNIVARYRKKPTDDGWIFTVDDSSDKKLNRYQQLSVVFKDYLSGDITIAESVDKATELTGILTTTIRNRLNSKAISSFSNELCSKYVFKKTDSIYVWPVYSVEEVHKSIKNHEARMKKY